MLSVKLYDLDFLLCSDVGRSCIIVSLGGKNVMLDCGMHMGYNDQVAALLLHCSLPNITCLALEHANLSLF